jgi:hypothetical protein
MLYYEKDGRADSKFTWYILGGCKFTNDRELETITNYSQQDATVEEMERSSVSSTVVASSSIG